MALQKIEWLQQEEVSSLSGVSSLLGVFEDAPVRVPASLLSVGSGFDPRLTMWLGSGASSGSPHIVFDSPLSSAGFLLLRFPYLIARECRFTVYGLKSSDISDYYYWDSSSAGSASIADRLSSDKRGVFGGWDIVGAVYVCFNLGAS